MVIFYSYVKLPENIFSIYRWQKLSHDIPPAVVFPKLRNPQSSPWASPEWSFMTWMIWTPMDWKPPSAISLDYPIWLVVSTPLKIMEFVSWDDCSIPN